MNEPIIEKNLYLVQWLSNPSLLYSFHWVFPESVLFAFSSLLSLAHFTHYDVIYSGPKHLKTEVPSFPPPPLFDFVVSDDINLCSPSLSREDECWWRREKLEGVGRSYHSPQPQSTHLWPILPVPQFCLASNPSLHCFMIKSHWGWKWALMWEALAGREIVPPWLPCLLPYGWASLVAQLVKNLPAMQGTWVWSLGWEDPLEKGKATHSCILAWRIPWTVQSTGSQRLRHDWVTFTFCHMVKQSLIAGAIELSPPPPNGRSPASRVFLLWSASY